MLRFLCTPALLSIVSLAPTGCDKATDTAASAPAAADDGSKAAPAEATPDEKAAAPGDDGAAVEAATTSAGDEAAGSGDTAAGSGDTASGDAASDDAPLTDKKVIIMGSSMVATGFGMLLEKELDEHPKIDGMRQAKSATGLARPDFFDWMDVARREIATHDPDLVVVLIGGNDGQDLQPLGKGKSIHYGTPEWEPAYRQRVDDFLKVLTEDGAHVLWMGIPRSNTVNLEGKMKLLRKIQIAAVEANENATYLPLSPFLEDADGALLKEAKVRGKFKELRGDDGHHLTMAGSRYLADLVLPKILEAIDMPPADALAKAADGDEGSDAPDAPDAPDEPAADDAGTAAPE